MSHTLEQRGGSRRTTPRAALDAEDVRAAYRRWAGVYDTGFGLVSSSARRAAVREANALPGRDVLEMGVGTGLALPRYRPEKSVTGIDLSTEMLARARSRVATLGLANVTALHEMDAEATSFADASFDIAVAMFVASVVPHPRRLLAEMLARARSRVATLGLANVTALHEMDAEATSFADASFDIAVAMFVASVVPHPRRLLAEMRRVVRPGGHLLFVNHFAAERGPRWWAEWALAPASRALGWHPDFATAALFVPEDMARINVRPMPPFGIFSLVRLRN